MRTLSVLVLTGVLAGCGEDPGTPAAKAPAPAAEAAAPAGTDTDAPAAVQDTPPEAPTPGVLTVGDAAPPLSAERWFRGEPRQAVTPGRVTLVEFWATWCGPCIAAMPHISGLAERLEPEGLDVVGVSIDRGGIAASVVETFLEERSELVSFEVMLDDGETRAAWMEAAGRNGIPCSFVVAQDGRIAWIGHPMEQAAGGGHELDRVIEGLLAGTYDVDAQANAAAEEAAGAALARAEQDRVAEQVAELSAEMGRLWSAGDRRGVLEYIDRIVALDAEGSRDLAQRKIEILLYELGDAPGALASTRALLEGPYAEDSEMMMTAAALFSGAADPGEEGRRFAVDTAERVVAMTDGTEPRSLVVLAEAQFAAGEPSRAADTMRAAMSFVGEDSPAYSTYELVLGRYLASSEAADAGDAGAGASAGG